MVFALVGRQLHTQHRYVHSNDMAQGLRTKLVAVFKIDALQQSHYSNRNDRYEFRRF